LALGESYLSLANLF
jgi:hypothetical protein